MKTKHRKTTNRRKEQSAPAPRFNSPQLIQKRRVEWRCKVPSTFKCMLCEKGRGDVLLHYGNGSAVVKLVVCDVCAVLPVEVVAWEYERKMREPSVFPRNHSDETW